MKLLIVCGALAAGEFAASVLSGAAAVAPFALILVALVGLFGYGWNVRGWPVLAVFLFGLSLYLLASADEEVRLRQQPWMRGRERFVRRAAESDAISRKIKFELSRRMGIGLENAPDVVGLGRAILLGERNRLPLRTRRIFVESGTMHVFAISGLHVMAVADVLTFLLLALLVPRRFVGIVAIPLLWGYVRLIGSPPSAVRAALMATFSLLAPLIWRRADGLRSWSLTFLLVHLLDPLMITNVGNVLSFAVMLAIVLVGDAVREWAKWKRTILVTMAAWAIGVPISAHVFGRVTPGGMVANLVLIATAKLTVTAGAVGVAVSFVSDELAAHLNNLCALGIRTMVLVAEGVSRLPGGNFETGNWTLLTCFAWYLALMLLVVLLTWRIRRRLI